MKARQAERHLGGGDPHRLSAGQRLCNSRFVLGGERLGIGRAVQSAEHRMVIELAGRIRGAHAYARKDSASVAFVPINSPGFVLVVTWGKIKIVEMYRPFTK